MYEIHSGRSLEGPNIKFEQISTATVFRFPAGVEPGWCDSAATIALLCHEWTTCQGRIFFSPLTHTHQLLLHSSHTHATITSYDLCFLRLIYHCSSLLPVLPRAPLGSIQEEEGWWWEKHTLGSHQPQLHTAARSEVRCHQVKVRAPEMSL